MPEYERGPCQAVLEAREHKKIPEKEVLERSNTCTKVVLAQLSNTSQKEVLERSNTCTKVVLAQLF